MLLLTEQKSRAKTKAQRPKPQMTYVELHARSAFSFLEGASVPEELIAAGLGLDMPAMALLDRDGVYGAPRFYLSGKKNGIKAHIGAEITVRMPKTLDQSPRVCSIPVLVRNRRGYQNLCRLITLMKLRVPKHAKPGEHVVTSEELAAHASGLVCLTGAADGPIASAIHLRDADNTKRAQATTEWLLEVFGPKKCLCRIAASLRSRGRSSQSPRDRTRPAQSSAFTRYQWRVSRDTRAPRSVRRLHLHSQSCSARNCRTSPRAKFRAIPEIRRDDAEALRGSPRSYRKYFGTLVTAEVHARRSRV